VFGTSSDELSWASLSKVAVALAVLVAVEEEVLGLDQEIGPNGSTVRELLSHAGGIAPDEQRAICEPGTRRIYSNAGFEILSSGLCASAGLTISDYLGEAVFEPLGMDRTRLEGSPASGVVGPVADLGLLLVELMAPTLIAPETAAAMRTVHCPSLPGILPGFGSMDPCPWGLGVEIRGSKDPHWIPSSWGEGAFGHFGRAGGFIAVAEPLDLGVATLGDEPFGPWSIGEWPPFLAAIRDECGFRAVDA
jgi:CubicO group peptidase (beta-lactamase class C family)